jgi:hypothetical protein
MTVVPRRVDPHVRRGAIAALSVVLAAVAACGKEGPTASGPAPNFTFALSGALTGTREGLTRVEFLGHNGFVGTTIDLRLTAPDGATVTFDDIPRRPVATYRIGVGPPVIVRFYSPETDSLSATDGRLTITSSTPTSMSGTFDFTATKFPSTTNVRAVGSFSFTCPSGC